MTPLQLGSLMGSTAPVSVSWATARLVRSMLRVGGPKPKRQPVYDTSNEVRL